MFRSVFLSGSVKTMFRVKRSFGAILAILGHFCKIEKARIGAISWADIGSQSFINLQKISPMAPDAKKLFEILVSQ